MHCSAASGSQQKQPFSKRRHTRERRRSAALAQHDPLPRHEEGSRRQAPLSRRLSLAPTAPRCSRARPPPPPPRPPAAVYPRRSPPGCAEARRSWGRWPRGRWPRRRLRGVGRRRSQHVAELVFISVGAAVRGRAERGAQLMRQSMKACASSTVRVATCRASRHVVSQ